MSYNLPSSDGYITLDGYVLTYVATNNKWEPKPSTASGGFTAGGDLTGTASSQQVVSLTGSSNIVNVPSPTALEFGSHSVASTTGLIRLGDINNNSRGTQLNILAYRNTANTADIPLISTDGFGDIEFSGPVGTGGGLQLLGNGTVSLNSSAGNFQISAIGNTLLNYIIPSFKTQAVTGAFTFDSIDANLTDWLFKINGTQIVDFTTTGTNIGLSTGNNTLTGSLTQTTRTVATSTFTIDTTTTDCIIFVDTTSNAVTITLPVPTNGRLLYFKDYKFNFTTNNFTLSPHSTEKIDGLAASKTFSSNGASVIVVSDGTDWFFF